MEGSLSAQSVSDGMALYEKYVNPQWVRLLDVLQMNVRYNHCIGTELLTKDGRTILDFNSGYRVHNAGHNHPQIKAAIVAELGRNGAAMLQTGIPELAGALGAQLCERAGGKLTKAFFASSGSEGVEAAIKFSRAHTGRAGLLSAKGSFHGLTCGALSLMSDAFWKDGFGPMLPEVEMVSFGVLDELAAMLATKRFAAFIVEPVQVEAGLRIPEPEYLKQVQALCRRYGTLFVLDEV
jgi:ornithine--oxo-acid transaminase